MPLNGHAKSAVDRKGYKVLATLYFMATAFIGRMASPLPRRFTFDPIKESSLLIQSRVDSAATNLEIEGT